MSAKVVLVEGITDAFLLSRLFISVGNYRLYKPIANEVKAEPDFEKYEWCETLRSPSGEVLLIFACGSCSRFHDCFQRYFQVNAEYGKISKLAIVRDADNDDVSKIEADLTNAFESYLVFQTQRWCPNMIYCNEFGIAQEKKLESYLLVVPARQKGILEDALLEAIGRRDQDDETVVREARDYIDRLKSLQKKYIQTYRMQRKAALASAFAVFEPSHTFQNTEAFFKSIRWKRFPEIIKLFDDLLKI